MHIAIPIAVIVGLIPIAIALTGEGLLRWLSFACALAMLFGLVAPPAAIAAWLAAMLFAIGARRAKRDRIATERHAAAVAKEELKRLKALEGGLRPPLARLTDRFRKKE